MTMRIIAAALGLCVLTGCTGLNMKQARSTAPVQTMNSEKTAQKIAQCVQFSWQDEAMFGVMTDASSEASDGGYTVFTPAATYFADIRPRGAGSVVSFYAREQGEVATRRLASLATCL
ncbi:MULTISPECIES: hypothetical protein [unclassified Pseudomonas]|uniref:hypothetical protein n=1 Tax=unclassified Pseudomonas TaxID=196821 RepID=UPI001FD28661|nr:MULTISPECIES: hypothetical protein [unclassified Pseudomonas]